LVTRSADYQLIAGQLHKLETDGILRRCVMEHEHDVVLYEAHEDVFGVHRIGK